MARDGLILNGISDIGSDFGSLVFSGYKMGTLARSELNKDFQRAQQSFIDLYKIPS